MKKFLSLLLLASFFSAHAQIKGDSWASVKSSGKGTLTVLYYVQPGIISDKDGKMSGLCVEILNDFVGYIKTKHGKDVTLKYEPALAFDKFLSSVLSNNNLLGATNVTITEERKKIMKFTPPYLINPLVMLTHKDAPSLSNLSEISSKFADFNAEVISGSVHQGKMEKIKKDYLPKLKIQLASTAEQILKDLSANPKLFTVLDFPEFVDATRKKLPLKRQAVDLGEPQNIGMMMSKQNDWEEVWKEFLTTDYRKSPKYRRMIADNFGAAFMSILK